VVFSLILILHFLIGIVSRKVAEKVIYCLTPIFLWLPISIMGIHIRVHGRENIPRKDGFLIATNHIGYIELFSILRIIRTTFVAKDEIQSWPLLGRVIGAAGTIFVNREKGGMSTEYIRKVQTHLSENKTVWFAPEKTTSDGTYLRPFSSALFVAANRAGAPILPGIFIIRKVNGKPVSEKTRPLVAWYDQGDSSKPFSEHFLRFLSVRHVHLDLHLLPAIIPEYNDNSITGRKEFSNDLRQRMASRLKDNLKKES